MKKRIVSIALALVLTASAFSACVGKDNPPAGGDIGEVDIGDVDTSFKDKDLNPDYDADSSVSVTFSESGATVNGSGASVSGNDVTIEAEGTYILGGACSDGSVTVDCGKGNKVMLVLSGLSLTCTDGPAIHIKSGKKITITLADGTENTVSDGASYADGADNADAAIFSKSDLVINGEGKLTVNGNYAHGIVSKDTLNITGGELEVNAVKSGISGKDCLKITLAKIKVTAGTDALKSTADGTEAEDGEEVGYVYIKDGEITLDAYKDGIQAASVINIEGGSFDIKTSATSSSVSAKGIKSDKGISISGGSFVLDTEDDGVHSNGDILICGGDFTIATGDDGVHSDTKLVITDGNIKITKSYEGLEAKEIEISGGKIDITSSDDGINAAGGNDMNSGIGGRPGNDFFHGGSSDGVLNISGGYIIMHVEGDGLDSNGTLTVSGGTVIIDGPSTGGNGSIDYDATGTITGGVVVALGSSDMAQNFSTAEQGSVLVTFNGRGAASTVMSICDESGAVIIAFTSTKTFACAVFSAPEIKSGGTYKICMGGTVEGLDENGFAHNTTVSGATELGSVTLTSNIYGSGSGMMGGGGGRPGGGPGGR